MGYVKQRYIEIADRKRAARRRAKYNKYVAQYYRIRWRKAMRMYDKWKRSERRMSQTWDSKSKHGVSSEDIGRGRVSSK